MPLDKVRLRRELRAARAAFSGRVDAQARIDAHLRALPAWSEVTRHVAVFAARPDEAGVDAAAAWARSRGLATAYPRVEGDRLRFIVATPEQLSPRTLGILEPPEDGPDCPWAAVDLFLVPGLGFTSRGDRLGHGRGYYDRALAEARAARGRGPHAPVIGVAFELQVVDAVPVEPHDVPLDGLVTEVGIRRFAPIRPED